jgi:GT2 family glycosyltransferase
VSPAFSVVVPTFERPARLARCLSALAALRPPAGGFEVVVVDDGGSVDLAEVMAALPPALEARLVRVPHGGPAAARNVGVASARGARVAFTDDDCRPEAGWLAAFADALDASPDALVGGRTVNGLPQNAFAEATQALMDYLYAYHERHPERPRFFASNNIALSRASFEAIGGFDARFRDAAGEDREFCDRCLARGRRLAFAPQAVVSHEHDLGALSFLRQHFAYGRGARRFHTLRAERRGAPLHLEPASFYLNLPRQAFRGAAGASRLAVAGLLVFSQAANAAGFLWPGKQTR